MNRSRRGYVMPLVILVMVVVGLFISLMMTRDRAQSRTVQRQIEAYQIHHGVMGIWAVFEAWSANKTTDTISELLDEDGFAFSIEPGDSTRIDLHLADGQGLPRGQVAGLSESQALDVQAVLQALIEEVGPQNAPSYTRDVGPWQVSVRTAPPVVLRAIASGLIEDRDRAQTFADVLIDRATEEDFGREALNLAMADAGLETAERSKVSRLVTVEPTLYEARITMWGTGVQAGLGLIRHYRSSVSIRPRGSNMSSGPRPSAPFLEWEEWPAETYHRWPSSAYWSRR